MNRRYPPAAQRPSRRPSSRGNAKIARRVVAALALLLAVAWRASADRPRDTMPFRVAFGRPPTASGDGTMTYLWIQGGRLRLRVGPDKQSHRVEGELRTSGSARLEDVTPLSEDLRIRQLRPDKLLFDVQTGSSEEGFDVTLAGDYSQLTIDVLIDGERRPAALRIGDRGRVPEGLPARLDLHNAESSWLARFGF